MTAIISKIATTIAAVKTAASSLWARLLRRNDAYYERHFRRHLSYLTSDLFSCLLAVDYDENLYLYERRVHKEKINCFYWMSGLEKFRGIENEVEWITLLLDAGQLRRRVTDHTVFGLCRDELMDVETALKNVIAYLGNIKAAEPLAELAATIDRFEDSFEHVVKVTAREPVVFILFLGALRAFHRAAAIQNDE